MYGLCIKPYTNPAQNYTLNSSQNYTLNSSQNVAQTLMLKLEKPFPLGRGLG